MRGRLGRPALPIRHGSEAGDRTHRRRGEVPCEACSQAARLARLRRARRAGISARPPPMPCGTVAAYQRHHYHGEEACEACREANNARSRTIYRGAERGFREGF